MTFPEFIAQNATWWDRLLCAVFGHRLVCDRVVPWHPFDTEEDRRFRASLEYCERCGRWPSSPKTTEQRR